jgi:hypothetical protein
MELLPELKRRFERIETAHAGLFEQMKAAAVPFWWHAPREAAGVILHNGTICRIDTGKRVIGVTAHHVYHRYFEERKTDSSFTCQFGETTVTPESLIIDGDRRLDLVTFDLSGVSASDCYVSDSWPPERPNAGDLVMYGGIPGTPRKVDMTTGTAHFVFDAITGLITDVGRESILICVDYKKLYEADDIGGEIVSTVGGGTSGGPVYRIDDSAEPFSLGLVGFIAEADSVLLARHASLIGADGMIQR